MHWDFKIGLILGVYRISFLANFFLCWVTVHEFLTEDKLTQLTRDPIRILNVFTFLWMICSHLYDSIVVRKKHRKIKPKIMKIKLALVILFIFLLIACTISYYRLPIQQVDISPILNDEEI